MSATKLQKRDHNGLMGAGLLRERDVIFSKKRNDGRISSLKKMQNVPKRSPKKLSDNQKMANSIKRFLYNGSKNRAHSEEEYRKYLEKLVEKLSD